ncbi:hypothetical protein D6D20_01792 [Aureobasidium pullulans]|uniref:Uncharacterized protein n=1 Tax=Aureobasidium pullulans TaxID=5580 RepID=A0A4S8ZIN2_AURPU|nr:hypothetical protein D6D20_01792 [Aureobasidium pullulans]
MKRSIMVESALNEGFSPGYFWGSDWLLIEHPDQHDFSGPTMPLREHLDNGFLNASNDELQQFINVKLPGHARAMYSTAPLYGVIDQRTAEDNTISFFIQDDNTLARYVDPMEHIAYNPENTVNMTAAEARANIIALKDELTDREALRFLELTSSGESLDDAAKAKERLNDWLDGEALNVTTRWYEFRLDATCAMGHINLIDDYGAFEVLTNSVFKEDMFDEEGIGRSILRP